MRDPVAGLCIVISAPGALLRGSGGSVPFRLGARLRFAKSNASLAQAILGFKGFVGPTIARHGASYQAGVAEFVECCNT